jgi:hypothetical protein
LADEAPARGEVDGIWMRSRLRVRRMLAAALEAEVDTYLAGHGMKHIMSGNRLGLESLSGNVRYGRLSDAVK